MNRKICVVSGTRAEYGLLRWVLSQKTDVVLLDPPSLREEIKKRLGRLI